MIDERKLLEDLDNWKKNLSGADTFQDVTLKLFIDVFKKKVETQPKITEFDLIDVIMERIKERKTKLQEDCDFFSDIDEDDACMKIAFRIDELAVVESVIDAAVVEFIESDNLDLPEEATHEAVFGTHEAVLGTSETVNGSEWKENMMKHFMKGD